MKPTNPPTILIAGGAGYIGSHANKILNERGFEEEDPSLAAAIFKSR
jgi:nucleoside-diphosphate-sugar epimerase